jgi:hypothetical protein
MLYVVSFLTGSAADCAGSLQMQIDQNGTECASSATGFAASLSKIASVGFRMGVTCRDDLTRQEAAGLLPTRRLAANASSEQYDNFTEPGEGTGSGDRGNSSRGGSNGSSVIVTRILSEPWSRGQEEMGSWPPEITPLRRATPLPDLTASQGAAPVGVLPAPATEANPGVITNPDDPEAIQAACALDVSSLMVYVTRATFAVMASVRDCTHRETEGHGEGYKAVGRSLCAVDIQGIIGSFAFVTSMFFDVFTKCPGPPMRSEQALCAADISAMVTALAGAGASAGAIYTTCLPENWKTRTDRYKAWAMHRNFTING